MEAEAWCPVSHCVCLAVQGRSGEASGPGQGGRSGRYPEGEWAWLKVNLEARARGNKGEKEGLGCFWKIPGPQCGRMGQEGGRQEANLSFSGSLWAGHSQSGHTAGGMGPLWGGKQWGSPQGAVECGTPGRARPLPPSAWSSHSKVRSAQADLAKSLHLLFLLTIFLEGLSGCL